MIVVLRLKDERAQTGAVRRRARIRCLQLVRLRDLPLLQNQREQKGLVPAIRCTQCQGGCHTFDPVSRTFVGNDKAVSAGAGTLALRIEAENDRPSPCFDQHSWFISENRFKSDLVIAHHLNRSRNLFRDELFQSASHLRGGNASAVDARMSDLIAGNPSVLTGLPDGCLQAKASCLSAYPHDVTPGGASCPEYVCAVVRRTACHRTGAVDSEKTRDISIYFTAAGDVTGDAANPEPRSTIPGIVTGIWP